MFFILGWLIGALLVGGLAHNWKGRDGLIWMIMAAIFTPLLMFVILLIVPDLKSQQIAETEAKKFNFEKFKDDLLDIRDLHSKGVYSEGEYRTRHEEILKSLGQKAFPESQEKYLIALASLVDSSVITREELNSLKAIIANSYKRGEVA